MTQTERAGLNIRRERQPLLTRIILILRLAQIQVTRQTHLPSPRYPTLAQPQGHRHIILRLLQIPVRLRYIDYTDYGLPK